MKHIPIKTLGFSLLMLLSGCGAFGTTAKNNGEETITEETEKTAKDGYLPISEQDENVLPPSFAGNYPTIGEYEFGGKAGNPYGDACPLLDFALTTAAKVQFTVAFWQDPMTFEDNTIMSYLGYEISILTNQNQTEHKFVTKEVSKLSELFVEGTEYCYGDIDSDGGFETQLYLYQPSKALGLRVNLEAGDKVEYVRFYYGDQPKNASNASVFIESTADLTTGIADVYSGTDFSLEDYTTNIEGGTEFYLSSPYGMIYSRDYLLSQFIYVSNGVYGRDFTLVDDDNYFTEGATAALGTEFQLRLQAYSKGLSVSQLFFHLIVEDKQGPVILPKEGDVIEVSYATALNQDFIDDHFMISDNMSPVCDSSILKENGESFSNKELGSFSAMVKSYDSLGNISFLPFTLVRIDDLGPEISCDVEDIMTTNGTILTSDYLLSLFTANDEIDGSCEVQIETNDYSENCTKLGDYSFVVSSTDKSGNVSLKPLTIHVREEQKPYFFAKESTFTFLQGNIPDGHEWVEQLIRSGILPDKNYVSYQVVSGQEINNDSPVGTYELTMAFAADDSSVEYADLLIEIIAATDANINTGKEKSWWAKFCQFWIDLWAGIVKFFTGK